MVGTSTGWLSCFPTGGVGSGLLRYRSVILGRCFQPGIENPWSGFFSSALGLRQFRGHFLLFGSEHFFHLKFPSFQGEILVLAFG